MPTFPFHEQRLRTGCATAGSNEKYDHKRLANRKFRVAGDNAFESHDVPSGANVKTTEYILKFRVHPQIYDLSTDSQLS